MAEYPALARMARQYAKKRMESIFHAAGGIDAMAALILGVAHNYGEQGL